MLGPLRGVAWLCLLSLGSAAAIAFDDVDLAYLPEGDPRFTRVLGSQGTGSFGVPVAGGFDCDGDLAHDFALGVMTADPRGRRNAGEVDLVFGRGPLGETLDTAADQSRILRILGAKPSEATGSEIWMDDVTGDGLGDLLIGRQNFDPGARNGAGALSIVVGGGALADLAATLEPLDLRAPPESVTLTTLVGASAFDRLGIWFRTGDVTGDGIADIVVGADQISSGSTHEGGLYVVRGGEHLAVSQTIDLASFGTTGLAGNLARVTAPSGSAEWHLGATCQIADLDGNQRAEVLAAATLSRAGAALPPAGENSSHGTGGTARGTLFVLWDDNFPTGSWPAGFTLSLAMLPGSLTEIAGGARNRSFGEEIVGGFDIDADAQPDLFVGDLTGRSFSGVGHLFPNAASLKGRSFDLFAPPLDVVIVDFLGAGVEDIAADTALAGDFDGDGYDDLGFSSPYGVPLGRSRAGILYVFHGRPRVLTSGTIDLGVAPPEDEWRVTRLLGANGQSGTDAGDTLAYSAAPGDVDGDGVLDIITNEMLGNGATPAAQDTGNLIVVRLPEPGPGASGIAALTVR